MEGKAKTTPHYSSACLPAADEASIPPPPLPLQIPHACVAGTPSSAGLRACTVSTTRSRFVPSLAWTLALVSVLPVPGNRGSTSGGCISYVCKNGPLGSGFQIHADMYLLSHTSVMLFFFHVYYMLLVHWSDPDTGCFRKRPDWCTCHVLKKHCIGALGDHCSRQSRQQGCRVLPSFGLERVMCSYSR